MKAKPRTSRKIEEEKAEVVQELAEVDSDSEFEENESAGAEEESESEELEF